MTDMTGTQDPAAIERDIRQTQEDMSRTVDRIGNQLTARNILNALLDKADDKDIDARALLDGARRNPLALALIAGGAIWLVSARDANFSSFRFGSASRHNGPHAPDHDVMAQMEGTERQDGEDPVSYQRRQDMGRADYLKVERGQDEDDASFRQRLDKAAQALRTKRRAWSDQAQHAGSAIRRSSGAALSRTQDMYSSNPIAGGLVAAGIGALVGAIFPISRAEEERLSGFANSARNMANEQKDRLAATLREKKDQLITSVDGPSQPAEAGPDPQPGTMTSMPQAAI